MTTPFFSVNSQNRLAVRKLLTSIGLDSAAVRLMRNGELGKALHDAVAANKLTVEAANAACATVSPTPDATPSESAVAAVVAGNSTQGTANGTVTLGQLNVGQTLDGDAAAALRRLLGVEAPKVDEAAMRRIAAKLVREEMVAAGQRPAVIEIKSAGDVIGKVDGKATHKAFATVMKLINTRVAGKRLHVMMVGESGSGKTYLSGQVAAASSLSYYMTGAVASAFQLIGFMPAGFEGNPHDCPTLMTPLRKAYELGGVFCWDEVDGSDPRALLAFNALLDGGDAFAFPDGMVKRHVDFVCIATANTWGTGATADFVGRNKLDAAFLKRFMRVAVNIDETLERDLVGPEYVDWAKFVQGIRRAAQKEGVKIIVTPRDSLMGAAALASGLSRDEVEGMTVFAGLDTDTCARLRAAA